MYCGKCGSPNPDNALSCANCGEILSQEAPGFSSVQPPENFQQEVPVKPVIPNYLVQSILLIVFSVICCVVCLPLIALPFAIIAVVSSTKVNKFIAMGDIAGAELASKNAKKWCWVSLWVLIATIVLGIILNIILYAALGSSMYWQDLLNEYQYENGY